MDGNNKNSRDIKSGRDVKSDRNVKSSRNIKLDRDEKITQNRRIRRDSETGIDIRVGEKKRTGRSVKTDKEKRTGKSTNPERRIKSSRGIKGERKNVKSPDSTKVKNSKRINDKNSNDNNNIMSKIKMPQIIIISAIVVILIPLIVISWPTEDGTKRIGNSEVVYDKGKVKLVKNINNEKIIVERLRDEGYSDYAIAGILARWRKESGIDPSIIEGQFAKSKVSRLIMARRMFADEGYREWVYADYSSSISLYEEAFFASESHTDKAGYPYHMLGLGLGQWTGRRAIAFLCYLGEDEWSENPKYKGWNSIERQLDYFCFDMDYEIAYGKSESYQRMLENNDISSYSVRFYPSYYQYICNAIHQDFRTLAPSSELSVDEVFQKTIDAMNTYEGGSAGVTIDDVREMYERISREWSDGK